MRQRRHRQKLFMIYVRYLVDNYVHNLKNPHGHWLCRTCLKFRPCRWPVSRQAPTAGFRWLSTHRHLEPVPRLEPRLFTSSKPMNLRSLRSLIFNFSGGLSVRNHRLAVSGFDRHRTVKGASSNLLVLQNIGGMPNCLSPRPENKKGATEAPSCSMSGVTRCCQPCRILFTERAAQS